MLRGPRVPDRLHATDGVLSHRGTDAAAVPVPVGTQSRAGWWQPALAFVDGCANSSPPASQSSRYRVQRQTGTGRRFCSSPGDVLLVSDQARSVHAPGT